MKRNYLSLNAWNYYLVEILDEEISPLHFRQDECFFQIFLLDLLPSCIIRLEMQVIAVAAILDLNFIN